MIRFSTYDEANLFAAMKRADGYFAEVIHQNAGHIWGAAVVHGFPVLVSEEMIHEDAKAPEKENKRLSEFAVMVAMFGLLGSILFIGMSLYIGFFVAMGVSLAFFTMPMIAKLMTVVLFFAVFFAVFFVFWGMLKLTRIYRRPNHSYYGMSRFILGSLMWVLVFVH